MNPSVALVAIDGHLTNIVQSYIELEKFILSYIRPSSSVAAVFAASPQMDWTPTAGSHTSHESSLEASPPRTLSQAAVLMSTDLKDLVLSPSLIVTCNWHATNMLLSVVLFFSVIPVLP